MDSDWGEVVTRYPYRKVRMDHLLSRESWMRVKSSSSMFEIVRKRTMGNE